MWFWEILGIEPTDDKTAIKRAYTKLAHNTNPEDDPEGYAKLHDAYKAALDYASGKYIFIENIEDLGADEEPAGTGKPAFDFSSVRDPNDPFTFNVPEIKNAIKNYRDANHIGSFAELFDLEKQELLNISAFLFKLYSALAVKTDDPGIWNDFFDEPIISYAINDENFRGFLTDSFPEGDLNRIVITDHIEIYKQDIADRIQAEENRKAKEMLIRKKANIWIYLTAGISTVGIILFFADLILKTSGCLLLSTSCAFISFGLYCVSRFSYLWMKINNGQAKPALPTYLYRLLSFVFIVSGIASIFEYGSFTDFNGIFSLSVNIIAAVAIILLMTVFKPS